MNTNDAVLDQIIMEDVSYSCPQEFMQYHKCISENHDDPSKCAYRQQDLSKCIKTKVPSIMKIMDVCGSIMQKYEGCIRENMEKRTINENCMGLLNEMRKCAMDQIDVSKRNAV